MIKAKLFIDPMREVQVNVGDWVQVMARLRAQLDVSCDGTDDGRREATEELQVAQQSQHTQLLNQCKGTLHCRKWSGHRLGWIEYRTQELADP